MPMRLDWKLLSRRFRTPLRTAAGEFAIRDSLVIRLTDADGRVGYGEVAPWPGFPVESVWDAADFIKNLTAEPESVPSDLPCVAVALSHAHAWMNGGFGLREVALSCAKLIRDAEDTAAISHAADEGYASFKLKIGMGEMRDEQRAVSMLIHTVADIAPVRLRLDANGCLNASACEAWCDFMSEFSEVEWLEQPMRPGQESFMRAIAEKTGVIARIALDESVCDPATAPSTWSGVLVVKPLLTDVAAVRCGAARIAYSSVFESPFGRQAALCIAADSAPRGAPIPVGFDTLGVFDDTIDVHAAGPVARTLAKDAVYWEELWNRL